MWSVGVMMMSGERGISWRRLVNGPIIAVVIGLALVALGLDDQVTGAARKAMSMIGVGAFPLAILITGCTIMDLAGMQAQSHLAQNLYINGNLLLNQLRCYKKQ